MELIFAGILLVVGLAGGVIPIFSKIRETGLHLLLAVGTGMLLGTIFLHMLPEAMGEHGSSLCVLLGLIIVFMVEKLFFGGHSHEVGHNILGLTALFGLSVHAAIVGFGIAPSVSHPETGLALISAITVHKFSETFALGTVFVLARYSRGKALKLMLIFASITPLTLLLGHFTLRALPEVIVHSASGIAAGTFLYVALLDLMPEVFHQQKNRWLSFAAMILGIVIIWLVLSMHGQSHVQGNHHH